MSQDEATGIARAVQRIRNSRRAGMMIALPTVAALGAGTALGIAAIPGGDGTITGCYVTNPNLAEEHYGTLRVIDPTGGPATLPTGGPDEQHACLNYETTITWNQSGPQGPQGPGGAQGPQGAPGKSLVGGTSFGFGGGSKTFLKLDGIKGESKDHDHKDEIEVSAFQLSSGSGGGQGSTGGGGGAGKVSIQSFSITKKIDKASPLLFKNAATGKHLKLAEVSFTKKSKGKQHDFLVYKLTDVLISSLQDGTSKGGSPVEQVTFAVHKITETFIGSNGKPVQTVSVTVNNKA